ncbi:hypothetical protein [Armatimonas rosea]|uniref:Uncharacterized protein n=1 Tax=Armatimonas rosea TaxID=685828 RepID=A0A7W9W7D7_ARMRO|nr:hypothetical protein [Armatimonas rosea]MBB6050522.1 hypothetical protein [Armatimonas rosea]
MTYSEIVRWVAQLQEPDYKKQLIALGRLVEAGDAAVPLLREALPKAEPETMLLLSALVAIGTREPLVMETIVQYWRWNLNNRSLNQAVLHLVRSIGEQATPGDIALLLPFLGCWRYWEGEGHSKVGSEASYLAATALGNLAQHQPTPQLREALPLLKVKKNFLSGAFPPKEFALVARLIEEATAPWKNLPCIVEVPNTTDDLPVPAEDQIP